ncbi:MAG TPA: VWA domain-containing protein, partial [Acidobacteriota bacterium]|nr:VWA domain-containing protein [Acidobacteriota bacterium]
LQVAAQSELVAPTVSQLPVPQLREQQVESTTQSRFRLNAQQADLSQWPTIQLPFSISQKGQANVTQLEPENIAVTLDGTPLPVRSLEFNQLTDGTTSVLFLLDGSGSMDKQFEPVTEEFSVLEELKQGFPVNGFEPGPVPTRYSKLNCAKDALTWLVDRLPAKTRLAFAGFNLSQRLLVPPTQDKSRLKTAIDSFNTTGAEAEGTRLYQGAQFALEQAQKLKIQNVILISDGFEYSPESQQLKSENPGSFKTFQQNQETQIKQLAQQSGVRLFTIAVGSDDPDSIHYVDRNSLKRMTDPASSSYINIESLISQAQQEGVETGQLLVTSLKSVFDSISQSIRMDYSLKIRMPDGFQPDLQDHQLRIGVNLNATELPVVITLGWNPTDVPVPMIQEPVAPPEIPLPQPPPAPPVQKKGTGPVGLVIVAGLLMLLVLVAAGLYFLWRHNSASPLRTSTPTLPPQPIEQPIKGKGISIQQPIIHEPGIVFTLQAGSDLIGKTCPNEGTNLGRQWTFKPGDVVVQCPRCGTPHHLSCWKHNQCQCWVHHCKAAA